MKNKKRWHPSGLDTGGVMCPKETERRQRSTRQVFKSHSKRPKSTKKKKKRFCSPQKPTLLQPTVAGPQRLNQHQQIVHRLIQGQGDLCFKWCIYTNCQDTIGGGWILQLANILGAGADGKGCRGGSRLQWRIAIEQLEFKCTLPPTFSQL